MFIAQQVVVRKAYIPTYVQSDSKLLRVRLGFLRLALFRF